MYDFKPGDKVQIDPALVNGGARVNKGVGVVGWTDRGGTECAVRWPGTEGYVYAQTRDLAPLAQMKEAE